MTTTNAIAVTDDDFINNDRLSQLICSFYQNAQTIAQKEFSDWLFAQLSQMIVLDRCIWVKLQKQPKPKQQQSHTITYGYNCTVVEQLNLWTALDKLDFNFPLNKIVSLDSFIDMNGEATSEACFQSSCKALSIAHSIAGAFYLGAGKYYAVVLFRHQHRAAFTQNEMSLLHFLQPHIVQAHRLNQFIGNKQLWHNNQNQPGAKLPSHSLYELLSKRKKELCFYLVKGGTDKQIGRNLNISHHTVSNHLKGIYELLDVQGRAEAIAVLKQIEVGVNG